jgi:hypothetical protein
VKNPDSGLALAASSSTLRAANAFLALTTLVVLGLAAWQHMRISSLAAELEQSRRDLAFKTEKLANEKLQNRREETVGAVAFLDDLYRSAEGLQRPGGLYNLDAQKVDAEAIGTWILDVYLKARIEGKSDAEARQSITDAIKGSDEWRRKHGR